MLKGLIVEKTRELPPRLHSLPRLAEAAGLAPDEVRADFLAVLSAYYVQSRYPEEIEASGGQVTRQIASETLRKTTETLKWLESLHP